MPGAFGRDGYGRSPYGSAFSFTSFRVIGAESVSSTEALVHFSFPINLTYAPFTDPANYSIPGLTVVSADIQDATSVRLGTSLQSYTLYTVTVAQGQSGGGDPLDVFYRTATFTGTPSIPIFEPVGVRTTGIRLVFSEPILLNAAVLDPASYTVTDIHSNLIAVNAVRSEQGAANPLAVVLTIDVSMKAGEWYVVHVDSGVVSAAGGLTVLPSTRKMQWIEPTMNSAIPIAKFSGEATGGLLTQHAGLVYFSPALDAAVSDSVIQIDSVEVCTKAYDEYVLPTPPDPPALFTYNGSVPLAGSLNGGAVLWGAFPRLTEAKVNLEFRPVEPMPVPVDSRCHATFTEQWDISYVAYLNNPAWRLYDGSTAVTPPTFICANNLGPIPPGPTTTIVLQPP